MKKIWSRLEGELTSKASEILESLNLGADESEVEALEEYIGQELPTDYRDFLIMHNGQSQESNPGFFDMFSLMPLDLVQESWDELEGLRDDAGEDDSSEETGGNIIITTNYGGDGDPLTNTLAKD